MKTITLRTEGQVEGGDEVFPLPATMLGMAERLSLLKEEIATIREQLGEKEARTRFRSEGGFQRWRASAKRALDWKRTERAWLADKYEQARKESTSAVARRRQSHAERVAERDAAKAKRIELLKKWTEEHKDDDFILLFYALFQIVMTIENEEPGVPPFTEDELTMIRLARMFLKEHGIPCGGHP